MQGAYAARLRSDQPREPLRSDHSTHWVVQAAVLGRVPQPPNNRPVVTLWVDNLNSSHAYERLFWIPMDHDCAPHHVILHANVFSGMSK